MSHSRRLSGRISGGRDGSRLTTEETSADALLTFTVTAPAATPINDFHLLLDGVVGSVLDVASLSNGVTLSSSDNLEHAATFAPVTSFELQACWLSTASTLLL
jgi:hypothetical protein